MNEFCAQAREALLRGGIAVIPTDTLYGIVARADDVEAVKCVYRVGEEIPRKPVIVLIAGRNDLGRFGVTLSPVQKTYLANAWPGKVSVILPCTDSQFAHIHRGGRTIAFRVPAGATHCALFSKNRPAYRTVGESGGLHPHRRLRKPDVILATQLMHIATEEYCPVPRQPSCHLFRTRRKSCALKTLLG